MFYSTHLYASDMSSVMIQKKKIAKIPRSCTWISPLASGFRVVHAAVTAHLCCKGLSTGRYDGQRIELSQANTSGS
jgi:hypothetical protein